MSTVGCSSTDAPADDGCVQNGSAALKTCAAGATVKGVDVSSYQGTVSWSQVKTAGREFAFVRVSDGLNYPDSKFATNWPATKTAGVIRGVYQYFRPGQDPAAQAKMVIDKLNAAGGLKPGDLPPVLDLETADGLSNATVVANAKTWLAKVQAGTGVKPIVYTAAFMSSVIGTGFGGYTLWVANYGTTCPTMPSGWTDWQFWQNDDAGNITGISGGVDTDFFNGTMVQLQALTIKAAASDGGSGGGDVVEQTNDTDHVFGGSSPRDGSQGMTLGSGTPKDTQSAPITPCQ